MWTQMMATPPIIIHITLNLETKTPEEATKTKQQQQQTNKQKEANRLAKWINFIVCNKIDISSEAARIVVVVLHRIHCIFISTTTNEVAGNSISISISISSSSSNDNTDADRRSDLWPHIVNNTN